MRGTALSTAEQVVQWDREYGEEEARVGAYIVRLGSTFVTLNSLEFHAFWHSRK